MLKFKNHLKQKQNVVWRCSNDLYKGKTNKKIESVHLFSALKIVIDGNIYLTG